MRRLRSQVKSLVKVEVNAVVGKTHCHSFETEEEIERLRASLLSWYDVNKRELQWRDLAKHSDPNIRAYSGSQYFKSITS